MNEHFANWFVIGFGMVCMLIVGLIVWKARGGKDD